MQGGGTAGGTWGHRHWGGGRRPHGDACQDVSEPFVPRVALSEGDTVADSRKASFAKGRMLEGFWVSSKRHVCHGKLLKD